MNTDRVLRALLEAEGYLELDLPQRALHALETQDDFGPLAFEGNWLTGEALRNLERHDEAVGPLREAVRLKPDSLPARLALGWCLKRCARLQQAIEVLEEALDQEDQEAIVPFNLACYRCLSGDKDAALKLLERALRMDPTYGPNAMDDPDLTGVRDSPTFGRLVARASRDIARRADPNRRRRTGTDRTGPSQHRVRDTEDRP